MYHFRLLALIVQWLGHLVVAEKTWVRFPLGAHNNAPYNPKDFSANNSLEKLLHRLCNLRKWTRYTWPSHSTRQKLFTNFTIKYNNGTIAFNKNVIKFSVAIAKHRVWLLLIRRSRLFTICLRTNVDGKSKLIYKGNFAKWAWPPGEIWQSKLTSTVFSSSVWSEGMDLYGISSFKKTSMAPPTLIFAKLASFWMSSCGARRVREWNQRTEVHGSKSESVECEVAVA
jgi:hypothetical protein